MEKKLLLFSFFCFFIVLISANESFCIPDANNNRKSSFTSTYKVNQDTVLENKTAHSTFIDLIRGLVGVTFLIGITYLYSLNRKKVSFSFLLIGLSIQIIVAFSVLYIPLVKNIINFIGKGFIVVLDGSGKNAEFLFGSFIDINKTGSVFAFQILPTIIFFSALMSLLFYLRIIQWIGNVGPGDNTLNDVINNHSEGMYSKLSLKFLLGKIFSPLMWLIGVSKEDLSILSRLMGEKIIFTGFVSYGNLTNLIQEVTLQSKKSIYAMRLC